MLGKCLPALLGAVLLSAPTPAWGAGASEPAIDRRSHELVRLNCAGGELSREVSLFANGTVRIRDQGGASPGMRLAELDEDQLDGFEARLEEIDMSEVGERVRGPSSETLEQCLLRLELRAGEVREHRFLRMAALPLALGRMLGVLDDVVAEAEERQRLSAGLPPSYRPRVGDILLKADGSRHRIVRITAEGSGVEIIQLESPLVVYLAFDSVRGEFVALESRRRQLRR